MLPAALYTPAGDPLAIPDGSQLKVAGVSNTFQQLPNGAMPSPFYDRALPGNNAPEINAGLLRSQGTSGYADVGTNSIFNVRRTIVGRSLGSTDGWAITVRWRCSTPSMAMHQVGPCFGWHQDGAGIWERPTFAGFSEYNFGLAWYLNAAAAPPITEYGRPPPWAGDPYLPANPTGKYQQHLYRTDVYEGTHLASTGPIMKALTTYAQYGYNELTMRVAEGRVDLWWFNQRVVGPVTMPMEYLQDFWGFDMLEIDPVDYAFLGEVITPGQIATGSSRAQVEGWWAKPIDTLGPQPYPSVVGHTKATAVGTTVNVPYPTNVADDVLILIMATQTTGDFPATLSGWTTMKTHRVGNSQLNLYRRRVTTPVTGSQTVTKGTSGPIEAQMLCVRGTNKSPDYPGLVFGDRSVTGTSNTPTDSWTNIDGLPWYLFACSIASNDRVTGPSGTAEIDQSSVAASMNLAVFAGPWDGPALHYANSDPTSNPMTLTGGLPLSQFWHLNTACISPTLN